MDYEAFIRLKEADTLANIAQETCQSCGKEILKDWRKKTTHFLLSVGIAYCGCAATAVIKKMDVEIPGFVSLLKASKIFAVGTSATAGAAGATGPVTPSTGTLATTNMGPTGPTGDVAGASFTYHVGDIQFPAHEKGSADGLNGPVAPNSFFENTVNPDGSDQRQNPKIIQQFYRVDANGMTKIFKIG